MIAPSVEISPVRLAGRFAGVFIGLAVLTCGIILLFAALEAALTGTHGCTTARRDTCDVALFVPISIFMVLGGLGAYLAGNRLPAGPRVTGLVWPALFLAVGGPFIESAVAGQGWGWAVLGAFFVLLGLAPMAFWTKETWKRIVYGPAVPAASSRPGDRRRVHEEQRWISPVRLPGLRRGPEAVPLAHPLVGELERLSALHRAGHLDDEEFAAAKARLLNGAH
ncbi:SHOCT domain-containing protein [Thermopolyspora sp. NPDC052614]|uniref:SHOCT domain-containing protein n=1 Tax=Thermopolyspora sp. NPDC052614 TaxID=3155682 RepID=UPI003436FDD7